MREALENSKLTWRNELELPSNYEKQDFFKNIYKFTTVYYYRWLVELSSDRHNRKFLPFDTSIITNQGELNKDISGNIPANVHVDTKKLFTLVTGMPANDNSNFFSKDKIKLDETFSELSKDITSKQLNSKERMLHTMLNEGVAKIIDERFSI